MQHYGMANIMDLYIHNYQIYSRSSFSVWGMIDVLIPVLSPCKGGTLG